MTSPSLDDWVSGSQRVAVRLRDGTAAHLSTRTAGAAGPHLTFLHGFPTSSFDWARVVAALASERRCLTFDFLGFGDSDKPADHVYTLDEQTDLTEAMWAHHGVPETLLVAHDYAVSVAQELLARHAEGRSAVQLAGVVFLNGGIYPDLHRQMPSQTALLDPERGPQLVRLMTAETFALGLRPTFSPSHQPSDADLLEQWRVFSARDGTQVATRLIQYIPDRVAHAERWTGAMERTALPCRFVWGMLDPVSGAHMAARVRERMPDRRLVALQDVGHWPSIEASEVVVAEVRAASEAR